MLVKEPEFACATAVSLAIIAMHFTHTLHPPGGATALIAIIGGSKVHALGFLYVLCPVLAGVPIMLLVALLVNNLLCQPQKALSGILALICSSDKSLFFPSVAWRGEKSALRSEG